MVKSYRHILFKSFDYKYFISSTTHPHCYLRIAHNCYLIKLVVYTSDGVSSSWKSVYFHGGY